MVNSGCRGCEYLDKKTGICGSDLSCQMWELNKNFHIPKRKVIKSEHGGIILDKSKAVWIYGGYYEVRASFNKVVCFLTKRNINNAEMKKIANRFEEEIMKTLLELAEEEMKK